MQKIKRILFIGLFSLILINPVLVSAQGNTNTSNTNTKNPTSIPVAEYKGVQSSISAYLCTPDPSGKDGTALQKCINKLYRFGVSFGAIALVFFIVFAGYMYITGGETGKGKAKSILSNAVIGITLLLSSYLILSFINPSLVLFKPIQPPIFDAADIAACSDVGLGQECTLPDGTIASGNGSGGGTAYANCPDAKLTSVSGVSTDGSVGQICPTLLAKLVQLKAKTTGIDWLVSSTVDGKHISNCHKPGTAVSGVCADLAMNGGRLPSYTRENGSTNPKWGELCAAINTLGGITIANEASKATQCPGYKAYDTTTGPNLHIFLSK